MPSKADVKAWKAQLVAQAEQQILKLTDSDRFKQYLNTLAKFHHYSARNIDLIYAQNPQATQVAGFKQWQTAFNRTVNKGAKSIRSLYNAFKDYLNQQTDLKVSEVPLATLNGAKGYFQPSTNEIVIGGDEPDNALKLKTLYHEYAHSQLHGLKSAFKDRPRAYQETQAEAVAYVAMQNIGVDTGNYSLGYVATWAKDKAVIHSALSEIQQVSNKVIELSDGLTKQLGLQKEPEHDLKKLSARALNQSYQSLQQQVQQARNPQQKLELKNKLNDIHHEINNRTQKQLQAFAEKNPAIKQPDSEPNQSLRR
ncbi:LtrC [Lactobacillus sp. ATCC 15578]|nr:LtrC [Lactobacillus sp. ATCC 15578]